VLSGEACTGGGRLSGPIPVDSGLIQGWLWGHKPPACKQPDWCQQHTPQPHTWPTPRERCPETPESSLWQQVGSDADPIPACGGR